MNWSWNSFLLTAADESIDAAVTFAAGSWEALFASFVVMVIAITVWFVGLSFVSQANDADILLFQDSLDLIILRQIVQQAALIGEVSLATHQTSH